MNFDGNVFPHLAALTGGLRKCSETGFTHRPGTYMSRSLAGQTRGAPRGLDAFIRKTNCLVTLRGGGHSVWTTVDPSEPLRQLEEHGHVAWCCMSNTPSRASTVSYKRCSAYRGATRPRTCCETHAHCHLDKRHAPRARNVRYCRLVIKPRLRMEASACLSFHTSRRVHNVTLGLCDRSSTCSCTLDRNSDLCGHALHSTLPRC